MKYRSATVVAIFLLLSGCIAESPPWELGLDVPTPLPTPASFTADYGDVAAFEAYLSSYGHEALVACGREGATWRLQAALGNGSHMAAIEVLSFACGDAAGSAGVQKASQLAGNASEPREYERERSAARATLDAWREALSVRTAATKLEVELLSFLMGWQVLLEGFYATGETQRAAYSERGAGADLGSAYANMMAVRAEAGLGRSLLDGYPWAAHGACRPINVEGLEADTARLAGRVRLLAASRMPDDALDNLGTLRGRLELETVPSLEAASTRAWWPRVATMSWELRHQERLFERWSVEAFPSRDEASFLIADHRAGTRSLTTDHALSILQQDVDYPGEWIGREATARKVLALPALVPDWSMLACPSG